VKLTPELVLERCKTDSLQKIKKLDVFSGDIDEASLIKELPHLEICSLSLNQIATLKFFANSQSLMELFLRKNQIADLFEVRHLQNCPKLKVLWLQDNPISQHPLYRQFIVKNLPSLVKLDNSPVSQEERLECQRMSLSD